MAQGMGRGMGGMGPRGFLTEEEKDNMPKVTPQLIQRILSYLKPYLPQLFVVFAAILISSVIGLLPSILTGRIVDEAIGGKNMTMLIKLLIAAFGTLILSQSIGVLESYINAWISQRIIYDMKNQMYKHLQHMPHAFFTTEKQGDIITRMNSDISGVSGVISDTMQSIVSNVAVLVTTLIALFRMDWQLAIIGIAVVPLLIIPSKFVGKQRFTLLSQSQAKNDEMNQMIDETLSVSGSLLTKIFAREEKEYERFVALNEEVTRFSLKEQRSGQWFRVVMGIFTQVGPLLIYFAGGYLIINRSDSTLTVGTITATVALINRLYRPVESLTNIHVTFTRSLALFTRIFDYFDRENTIKNPENGQKPVLEKQPIAYEHVAFSYEEGNPILTDVNFEVPGGAMYAVVGPSGSGKSTVVNLAPRLYDVTGGRVTIGGVDVREMDLSYLRRNIGMVTQDTYLFNGTIRDNLLYAKENATQEELEEACKIANIHDFILRQPDGYDTMVGNRGLKLSGGEKQRLSIARVILKDPQILILDEATSALDSISEAAIQDALERMMENRTSIVIAHRLSTILKADSILVVKGGVIAEQGAHDDLLSRGGIYRELYETQFRQAIDYEAEHGGTEDDFDLNVLSSEFAVKQLQEEDMTEVFHLCRKNRRFYRTIHERPRRKELTEMMTNAAAGQAEGNRFVGFYDENDLIAVIDLIKGYPGDNEAYIGWFMVDAERQGNGIGSQLFADVRAALEADGCNRIVLACPSENEDALRFWEGQGFTRTGETVDKETHTALLLEKKLA